MAALGLIAQHPGSTGYDLLKIFDISLANVWPATQSQLYGELGKLTTDGLIEVTATGPRGRKEYRATEAGHTALRSWLVDEDPEPRRNPVMLKVFLLTELGPDGADRYLSELADGLRSALDELDRLRADVNWEPDLQDKLGWIVLEWGRRLCRMQIEWAGWARAELAAPGAPGAAEPAATDPTDAPAGPADRP